MKINTALILCAGYGKRLNPLTLKKPKPLLEVNNIALLENTINLLEKLQIQNIKINTFYLQHQIKSFISNKKFNANIEIIEDGESILETGGGIFNLIKSSKDIYFHYEENDQGNFITDKSASAKTILLGADFALR